MSDKKKNKVGELIERYQQNGLPQISERHKHTYSHTYVATLLVFVGVVLVLNKTGYLPWNIWSILWRFWPVVLVMLGLHAIAGKSIVINILVTAIGIGLTASIVGFAAASVNPQFNAWLAQFDPQLAAVSNQLPTNPGPKESKVIVIPGDDYPNAKLKTVNVQIEAGNFQIADTSSDNYLNFNASYFRDYGQPIVEKNYKDNNLIINLSTKHLLQKSLSISENLNYNAEIGRPTIPISLTANVIAGSLNAKLTKTKVTNLNLTTTAGALTLILDTSSIPSKKFTLDVGAGALTIKLPYNTFAKINYETGVGLIKVDNQLLKGSGSYTTPNFRITTEPIVIYAFVGAGTIIIDTSGNF